MEADRLSKMTDLAQLVVDSRGYMSTVAKAKTAKLSALDQCLKPDGLLIVLPSSCSDRPLSPHGTRPTDAGHQRKH